LIEDYPALIVTGPRQIGKSTMVKNLLHIDNLTHVSMDDQQIRDVITNQPNIFFKTYKTPLFIDEVQKAPSIFNNIKLIVDKNEQKGQFILTGSQKFKLMKGVTESLAGRAAILEMQSLSQSEINGFENFTFINSYEMMEKRYLKYHAKNSKININERIVNGSMPTIVTNQVKKRTNYYKSYIETVLFKDIDDDIVKLYNKVAFSKFLAIIANYSGNVINMNNIARHVNVD
jgi:predicted AAA+ superfamily ATPase